MRRYQTIGRGPLHLKYASTRQKLTPTDVDPAEAHAYRRRPGRSSRPQTSTRQKLTLASAGSALSAVIFCRVSAVSGDVLPGQRSLLDGGDVELELDLVRHQEATGLEGGVPGQAPVLAGDGGVALEADPEVAERVAGGA